MIPFRPPCPLPPSPVVGSAPPFRGLVRPSRRPLCCGVGRGLGPIIMMSRLSSPAVVWFGSGAGSAWGHWYHNMVGGPASSSGDVGRWGLGVILYLRGLSGYGSRHHRDQRLVLGRGEGYVFTWTVDGRINLKLSRRTETNKKTTD